MRVKSSIKAMTMIEILIVVLFMGMISTLLYHVLSNGLKVWKVSQRLVVEEDIALFFEKITKDLKNSFFYSQIEAEGDNRLLVFPTIVWTKVDARSEIKGGDYINQIGRVEYSFDRIKKQIHRRQSNYSQALNNEYGEIRVLTSPIENLKFRYYYLTDTGEVFSDKLLEGFPSGIEIEVEFSDNRGQRMMKKNINIPVGS